MRKRQCFLALKHATEMTRLDATILVHFTAMARALWKTQEKSKELYTKACNLGNGLACRLG